ncbi:MAG: twin transmembrane helix small protein [Halocynthiibacter sp.]
MSAIILKLAYVAIAAVALVLVLGMGGFAKGGDFNKSHANKLMRYRIIAQFIAVALIMLVIYLKRNGA